ncbi:MAG: hypothetical protein ABIQ05_05365 [Candidatus Limnocylindria bacterium]
MKVEALTVAGQDDSGSKGVLEDGLVPVGPGEASTSFDPTRLDFGHYIGMTIAELAAVDADYLRWLERHPSGHRYRSEIQRVLGVTRFSTDWRE